jgi:hypothetical protein
MNWYLAQVEGGAHHALFYSPYPVAWKTDFTQNPI